MESILNKIKSNSHSVLWHHEKLICKNFEIRGHNILDNIGKLEMLIVRVVLKGS